MYRHTVRVSARGPAFVDALVPSTAFADDDRAVDRSRLELRRYEQTGSDVRVDRSILEVPGDVVRLVVSTPGRGVAQQTDRSTEFHVLGSGQTDGLNVELYSVRIFVRIGFDGDLAEVRTFVVRSKVIDDQTPFVRPLIMINAQPRIGSEREFADRQRMSLTVAPPGYCSRPQILHSTLHNRAIANSICHVLRRWFKKRPRCGATSLSRRSRNE